jgi:hypothetical protein
MISEESNDLGFYFLIKNDENPVTLEGIKSEYNKFLHTADFRRVAGAFEMEPEKSLEHCTIFIIGKFPENMDLENKNAVHPKKITCAQVYHKDFPEQLKNVIGEGDILLRIDVDDSTEILQEISDNLEKPYYCMFQFRIFLGNFISEKTLEYWKSSNKSWAVDFDLHKKRGYEHFIYTLQQGEILRYPKSVELWFTIPHSHFFVASSPAYEKAFRLKLEDIEYKTERREVGEFQTRGGDYAVKIMNKTKDFVEFSIICVSPFLRGEEPQELKEKIEHLNEDFKEKLRQTEESLKESFKESLRQTEERFITWKELVTPLTLLVTLLSLVVSVTVVLVVRMEGYNENVPTPSGEVSLGLLILTALFTGTVVWAIAFSLSFASKKYLLCKKSPTPGIEGIIVFPRNLAFAIILVWLVLYAFALSRLW